MHTVAFLSRCSCQRLLFQRHFVLRIEDNWHPSLYAQSTSLISRTKARFLKGTTTSQKAAATQGRKRSKAAWTCCGPPSPKAPAICHLSSASTPLWQRSSRTSSRTLRSSSCAPAFVLKVKKCNVFIMHFHSAFELRRWSDAFSWVRKLLPSILHLAPVFTFACRCCLRPRPKSQSWWTRSRQGASNLTTASEH